MFWDDFISFIYDVNSIRNYRWPSQSFFTYKRKWKEKEKKARAKYEFPSSTKEFVDCSFWGTNVVKKKKRKEGTDSLCRMTINLIKTSSSRYVGRIL